MSHRGGAARDWLRSRARGTAGLFFCRRALIELAIQQHGYTSEPSYGTHFFQDLVEADIAIIPIFPDEPGSFLNEKFLLESPNLLAEILPEVKDCDEVVRVIHVPSLQAGRFLQVYLDVLNQEGIAFFGPKQGKE